MDSLDKKKNAYFYCIQYFFFLTADAVGIFQGVLNHVVEVQFETAENTFGKSFNVMDIALYLLTIVLTFSD